MAMNQIIWLWILQRGYLALWKHAARSSLADTCTMIAWEDILLTTTTVMSCYFTPIGKVPIRVALMMAWSPTICLATANISFPAQGKNAAKSSTNGTFIPVRERCQIWRMATTIPIGLGVALLVRMTTKCRSTCSITSSGICLRRVENAVSDSFTGSWTLASALKQ